MSNTPSYQLNEFILACKKHDAVFVVAEALQSAADDFKLKTQQALRDFISNGGLEKPNFINSKPWKNNPDNSLIKVDAYIFLSGNIQGYIAFLKGKQWVIKSFKSNTKS